MQPYQLITSAVYIVLLIMYLFSETSGNFKRRCVNKIAMASVFLIYALVEFFRFYNGGLSYWLLLLPALVLAWLGDVLLLWSFFKGGVAFMLGNFFFASFLITDMCVQRAEFSRIWWCIIVFAVLFGTITLLAFKDVYKFGKDKPVMLLYMFSVTLHGSLALALAAARPCAGTVLLGIGLALFMVSDYFLMTYKFVKKTNWILRCNSSTYFFGMLLVALSMTYLFV